MNSIANGPPGAESASSQDPRLPARPAILVVAGEVSGDMHAAAVIRAMRSRRSDIEFFGIGGRRMRAAGVDTLHDVDDMAVMGFTEVLRRLGFFKEVFQETIDLAYRRKPDAALLVDYPGFNLRLAARLHALGIKVIYYICPQVWAWNRARIPRMARVVDKLITIFSFEAEHFSGTNLDVEFAGHPLVDEAKALLARPAEALPWGAGPGVALLPGSRRHVIERLLPVMWKAAAMLDRLHRNLHFILPAPSDQAAAFMKMTLARLPPGPAHYHVVSGRTREVLRQARAALVASGTATIEAALMSCPMAIAYKMSPLTHLLSRFLVRVDHIGMVNIVAGRRICPEFIQRKATPAALARAIEPLLDDTPERARMIEDLRQAVETLGPGGASEKAAEMTLTKIYG